MHTLLIFFFFSKEKIIISEYGDEARVKQVRWGCNADCVCSGWYPLWVNSSSQLNPILKSQLANTGIILFEEPSVGSQQLVFHITQFLHDVTYMHDVFPVCTVINISYCRTEHHHICLHNYDDVCMPWCKPYKDVRLFLFPNRVGEKFILYA